MVTSSTGKKANFFKYILHIFNIVFFIAGICSLAVGILVVTDKNEFVAENQPSTNYLVLANCLVTISGIVFLVALLGCAVLYYENRPLLLLYMFLLLFIFVSEGFLGTLSFLNREHLSSDLETSLNTSFIEKYPFDKKSRLIVNDMQQQMKCCGLNNFEDWKLSNWYKEKESQVYLVPDSCCKTIIDGCGKSTSPNNIPHTGCIHRLDKFINNKLNVLGSVSLGMCSIQIVGIFISMWWYLRLQKQYRYSKPILIR